MFSIGFKPGDLGSVEKRHLRTFHIQVIPKHFLQPLCLTWIPILQERMVIRKNITFFRSRWWALDKCKSTWFKCSPSWIHLDVNNDVSFCNLSKVLRRVLSSPEDNFLGWFLLFWHPSITSINRKTHMCHDNRVSTLISPFKLSFC